MTVKRFQLMFWIGMILTFLGVGYEMLSEMEGWWGENKSFGGLVSASLALAGIGAQGAIKALKQELESLQASGSGN